MDSASALCWCSLSFRLTKVIRALLRFASRAPPPPKASSLSNGLSRFSWRFFCSFSTTISCSLLLVVFFGSTAVCTSTSTSCWETSGRSGGTSKLAKWRVFSSGGVGRSDPEESWWSTFSHFRVKALRSSNKIWFWSKRASSLQCSSWNVGF